MDIFQQVRIDIMRILKSPKIYIVMIISAFFVHKSLKVYKIYAAAEHLGVTPYTYPVYFSDWMNCVYILLAITVLMSDTPFRGNNELFLSLRMNKYRWIISKIIFIMVLSFSFQIFLIIVSIIIFFPYIGLNSGWGDVLHNCIYNSGTNELSLGDASSAARLIETYIPIKAVITEFLLLSLFGMALGLLVFLLNELFWRYSGVIVSLIIVCSDLLISNIRHFSNLKPGRIWEIVSWFNLGNQMYSSADSSISPWSVLSILAVSIFILIFLIILAAKRKLIKITKEN